MIAAVTSTTFTPGEARRQLEADGFNGTEADAAVTAWAEEKPDAETLDRVDLFVAREFLNWQRRNVGMTPITAHADNFDLGPMIADALGMIEEDGLGHLDGIDALRTVHGDADEYVAEAIFAAKCNDVALAGEIARDPETYVVLWALLEDRLDKALPTSGFSPAASAFVGRLLAEVFEPADEVLALLVDDEKVRAGFREFTETIGAAIEQRASDALADLGHSPRLFYRIPDRSN